MSPRLCDTNAQSMMDRLVFLFYSDEMMGKKVEGQETRIIV